MKEKKMIIKAPTDGLVIYGDARYSWGRDISVGKEVWNHTVIITLPDLSQMQALLQVHEIDIRSLKINMPVILTVASAGGLITTGKITKIAELANAGSWRTDPEIKQFDVEVTFDKKGLGLKPGTTAKVEIPIIDKKNILYVPVRAILKKQNSLFCYVKNAKEWVKRKIQIGVTNNNNTEIVSGLKEGEEVKLLSYGN